jgi:hypothetical protein
MLYLLLNTQYSGTDAVLGTYTTFRKAYNAAKDWGINRGCTAPWPELHVMELPSLYFDTSARHRRNSRKVVLQPCYSFTEHGEVVKDYYRV